MGSMPQATLATSVRRMGRSPTFLTAVRPSAARSVVMARLRTITSVEPVLRKPPVVVLAAAAAAAESSSKLTPWACMR